MVIIGVNVATCFAILSVVGIVLGAFAAFGQTDFKRLVAYSSVNHMGFVGIGIAVLAQTYAQIWSGSNPNADVQTAILAANGTVLQMFNHGLSSAGMFLLAGALYHKTHTRELGDYGGLWVKAPVFGAILLFTSFASLGLPGLNGFVSEFLIVRGSWPVFTALTAIAMIGLLFTGGYILKGIRAVLHGPFNLRWRDYNLELTPAELLGDSAFNGTDVIDRRCIPNWILPHDQYDGFDPFSPAWRARIAFMEATGFSVLTAIIFIPDHRGRRHPLPRPQESRFGSWRRRDRGFGSAWRLSLAVFFGYDNLRQSRSWRIA